MLFCLMTNILYLLPPKEYKYFWRQMESVNFKQKYKLYKISQGNPHPEKNLFDIEEFSFFHIRWAH